MYKRQVHRSECGGTDASDASNQPTVTTTFGPSGSIVVYPFLFAGDFREDDTIVHVSDSPDCIAHVWGATKPNSDVGNVTVTSALVGQAGGPTVPIVISADPQADMTYAGFPDQGELFLTPSNGETVQVQIAGTNSVPAMPVTTLNAPVLDGVTSTEPVLLDAGGEPSYGDIDSKKPLVLKWQVADAGPATGQRVVFHTAIPLTSFKAEMTIDCSWPLSAGTGTVPASLLTYLRERAGGGDLSGYAQVDTGDMKEVVVGGASYVVIVSRLMSPPATIGLK